MNDDLRLLRALIAAVAPLAGVGCTSVGEFDQKLCVGAAGGLDQLAPVEGTDFVALRSVQTVITPTSATILSSWGTACETAADEPACAAAVAAIEPGTLFQLGFDAISAFDVIF